MDRIQDMASGFDPADVQGYLQGIDFPSSKDEVASGVQRNGGAGDIVDKIKNAAQERFDSPQDVLAAIKGA